MNNNRIRGLSLYKRSRYYLDPTESNGKVKILKPADPKKLEELKKIKKTNSRLKVLIPLESGIPLSQLRKIKKEILL